MNWVSAEMEYTALAGTVMSGEARLLQADIYEKIIQARDMRSALRALQDTPYSDAAEAIAAAEHPDSLSISRSIGGSIERRLAGLISQAPEDPVIRIKLMEWECHNFKIMLKYKFSSEGYLDSRFNAFRELGLGEVEESIYNYSFLELNMDGIRELKKHPLQDLHAYTKRPELSHVIRGVSSKALMMEKEHLMASSEAVLDLLVAGALTDIQMKIADEIPEVFEEDRTFIKGYLARRIDLQNISLAVRKGYRDAGWDPAEYVLAGGTIPVETMNEILRYEIPRFVEALRERLPEYGRALHQWHDSGGGASAFATLTRSLTDRYVRSGLFVFGPARVFSYLHWLEREYRTLTGVLIARMYGLDPERIKEVYGLGQ